MNQEISLDDPNLQLAVFIDFAATRYNLLPSEFIRRADTVDLYIMDLACSYTRFQQDQAEAKSKGLAPPSAQLSIEQMQSMMERVRNDYKIS